MKEYCDFHGFVNEHGQSGSVDSLNELADQGWAVVACSMDKLRFVALLEREKPITSDVITVKGLAVELIEELKWQAEDEVIFIS